jgi:hypothetical protein
MQSYETSVDHITHPGNLYVVVGNSELSNKMAFVYDGSQNVYYQSHFTLLMVFVLLWIEKESIVENFLFVLHHWETLSTGQTLA